MLIGENEPKVLVGDGTAAIAVLLKRIPLTYVGSKSQRTIVFYDIKAIHPIATDGATCCERTKYSVRALGEVVLRVHDLNAMQDIYENVIGLQVLRRFDDDGMTFFKISEGYGRRTTILALFPHDWHSNVDGHSCSGVEAQTTTSHHFALTIPLAEYQSALTDLEGRGLHVTTNTYPWIGWRSIYVQDPEGNVVELVCFDPGVLDAQTANAGTPKFGTTA